LTGELDVSIVRFTEIVSAEPNNVISTRRWFALYLELPNISSIASEQVLFTLCLRTFGLVISPSIYNTILRSVRCRPGPIDESLALQFYHSELTALFSHPCRLKYHIGRLLTHAD
jgi:hypothetical protein